LQKKQALVKKLQTGLREISCIAIHPGGMYQKCCSALVNAAVTLSW